MEGTRPRTYCFCSSPYNLSIHFSPILSIPSLLGYYTQRPGYVEIDPPTLCGRPCRSLVASRGQVALSCTRPDPVALNRAVLHPTRLYYISLLSSEILLLLHVWLHLTVAAKRLSISFQHPGAPGRTLTQRDALSGSWFGSRAQGYYMVRRIAGRL